MSRARLNLDERSMGIVRKISTALYIITIYSLIGVQLYRQFVLHQPTENWEDIAVIITFNVVVWLGSLLYLSGIVNPKNINLRYLLAGYLGFILLGFVFTVFKYNVLESQPLSMEQVLDYLLIVVKVSGGLAIGWGVLAYLGSRRLEKEIG
jgi:hypothetical protein